MVDGLPGMDALRTLSFSSRLPTRYFLTPVPAKGSPVLPGRLLASWPLGSRRVDSSTAERQYLGAEASPR